MKTLIDAERIQQEVARLGARIAEQYRGESLTVLGVLTGSIVLLADLIRCIDVKVRVGLIQASSYRGKSVNPGELSINMELLPDIRNRRVLLIDDIFDTGHTMQQMIERVRQHGPLSLTTAVLLRKLGRSEVDIEPDHACFEIPDVFVVGYGLDYDDDYRHLPYIAALEDSDL
ncbi:MAG: hypoxanthine phosphoribosyltransferase [Planctomycetota bacterium]|nr:hypoxanthine phosphoribosyltransferase [Planctomycetota bacterium]